jgi:hypothetical protein
MATPQKRFFRPAQPLAEAMFGRQTNGKETTYHEALALAQKVWRMHTDHLLYGRSRLELTEHEASMLKGE